MQVKPKIVSAQAPKRIGRISGVFAIVEPRLLRKAANSKMHQSRCTQVTSHNTNLEKKEVWVGLEWHGEMSKAQNHRNIFGWDVWSHVATVRPWFQVELASRNLTRKGTLLCWTTIFLLFEHVFCLRSFGWCWSAICNERSPYVKNQLDPHPPNNLGLRQKSRHCG